MIDEILAYEKNDFVEIKIQKSKNLDRYRSETNFVGSSK